MSFTNMAKMLDFGVVKVICTTHYMLHYKKTVDLIWSPFVYCVLTREVLLKLLLFWNK
jgi:hypothetical protein